MAIVVLIGIGILYYRFNPVTLHFFPQCPFRLLTGFSCPACGIQRALYAVLHGHWLEACNYNWFFIFSIPYTVLLMVAYVIKHHRPDSRIVAVVEHQSLAIIYVVLFFVWWLLRNILGI